MGGSRKAKRDEDEEESRRVLKQEVQNPSTFWQEISLHMFLEDGTGHADRPVDLFLLFF